MGITNKRRAQLKKMTSERMQHQEAANRSFVVESRNYVFAAGLQYCRATLAFLLSSVVVPSRSYFYEIQAQMVGPLWSMAEVSMKKALSKLKPNTIVKIDGAWDHRRNGKTCFVTFFDSRHDKIIIAKLLSAITAK